jgi:hypothetical protein
MIGPLDFDIRPELRGDDVVLSIGDRFLDTVDRISEKKAAPNIVALSGDMVALLFTICSLSPGRGAL